MSTPFMSIKDTSEVTGLSQFYLRQGCKDGSIPCIRCGTKFMINVPLYLESLNQKCLETGIQQPEDREDTALNLLNAPGA